MIYRERLRYSWIDIFLKLKRFSFQILNCKTMYFIKLIRFLLIQVFEGFTQLFVPYRVECVHINGFMKRKRNKWNSNGSSLQETSETTQSIGLFWRGTCPRAPIAYKWQLETIRSYSDVNPHQWKVLNQPFTLFWYRFRINYRSYRSWFAGPEPWVE